MTIGLPHPIPYQGSKRSLAPTIGRYLPGSVKCWYEPFAGSAAMTLWAASKGIAKSYVISDALVPITELWRAILNEPEQTSRQYRDVWAGQVPGDLQYFNRVRERYNTNGDPVDLLYLICRCVKNAVRFNKQERFTQSVDKRRLGMRPEKMHAAISAASKILRGRTEVRAGDWLSTTEDATLRDFIYMDPPYLGTTIGRDKRYAQQLELERLTFGLSQLRERRLRFALSYDGMTGSKVYGEPLPEWLGLVRILVPAGRSSQATLSGRQEETIESLYLTPGLKRIVKTKSGLERDQLSLDL